VTVECGHLCLAVGWVGNNAQGRPTEAQKLPALATPAIIIPPIPRRYISYNYVGVCNTVCIEQGNTWRDPSQQSIFSFGWSLSLQQAQELITAHMRIDI